MERELETKTDLELIEAAFDGNVESFGELCSRYYTAMVALAHSKVNDKNLAEDVAQQTFTKACFKLRSLRDKSKFASWLGTICRNVCTDMLRRSNNYEDRDLSTISAEQKSNDFEGVERVRTLLTQLPEKMREIIYLKFYDGMTYEKISQVLGISRQAINGRLRRAKKLIAKNLKKLDGDNYERAGQ